MIHVNTEDNFYVKSWSFQHAPTDMWLTLDHICCVICEGQTYRKNPGSKVNEVPNMFFQGLLNYTWSRTNLAEQQTEVEGCSTEDMEADLDAI